MVRFTILEPTSTSPENKTFLIRQQQRIGIKINVLNGLYSSNRLSQSSHRFTRLEIRYPSPSIWNSSLNHATIIPPPGSKGINLNSLTKRPPTATTIRRSPIFLDIPTPALDHDSGEPHRDDCGNQLHSNGGWMARNTHKQFVSPFGRPKIRKPRIAQTEFHSDSPVLRRSLDETVVQNRRPCPHSPFPFPSCTLPTSL